MDTPPQTPNQFIEFLQKEIESSTNLRDAVTRDLSEKRISGFKERKVFLQNLVIASVTLLGLISAFSVIGKERIDHPYFTMGIGSHLFLICFVVIYLREHIDQDNEGLLKLQDHYIGAMEEKIEFVRKTFSDFANNPNNTQNKLKEYFDGLKNLTYAKKIKEDVEKGQREREDRRKNKVLLEFNGEIAVFLFVVGTTLIFLSILEYYLPIQYLLLGLLLTFYFIFTDSLSKWLKPIFRALTFITRFNILSKKPKTEMDHDTFKTDPK